MESEEELKQQLLEECDALKRRQGQAAVDKCKAVINTNMDTIYNDLKAGKKPTDVCIDIKECPAQAIRALRK